MPLEDLVHAGVIGLIDALNKFDSSKHVQFGSYAKFRIRGAILDSLREMDWGPRELRRKARKVEEAHRKLSLELSRAPTENEVAAELRIWRCRDFQHLLGELDGLEVGSLRVESPWDGKEEDLCDYLPNAPEDTPFFRCLRSEMKDLLARVIAELPEKEQQVLALYYFEELTMKEVGAVLRHRGIARIPDSFPRRGAAAVASGRDDDRRRRAPASRQPAVREELGRRMEKVLNQEEIDAMVRAARGGSRAETALPLRPTSNSGTCAVPGRSGASNCKPSRSCMKALPAV